MKRNHDGPTYLLEISWIYFKLGQALQVVHNFDKAVSCFEVVLELQKYVFQSDHLHIAQTHFHLGNLYLEWGDLDYVLGFILEYGRGPFSTSAAMYLKQAEEHHDRAYQMRNAKLPHTHPDVYVSLSTLGRLFLGRSKFEMAAECFSELLDVHKTMLEEKQEKVPSILQRIGDAHLASMVGDRSHTGYLNEAIGEKAIPYYNSALQSCVELFGEYHMKTVTSLRYIGRVYRETGDLEEANFHFARAFSICCELFGFNHPEVAEALNYLGEIHVKCGRFEKAKRCFGRALAIQKRRLGKKHRSVSRSLMNIGDVQFHDGLINKAARSYARALSIQDHILHKNHPDLIPFLAKLGATYSTKGDWKRAAQYVGRMLRVYEQTFPPAFGRFDQGWHDLGIIKTRQGMFDQAEYCFNKTLQIREDRLKTGDGRIIASLEGLIHALHDRGDSPHTYAKVMQKLEMHKIESTAYETRHLDEAAVRHASMRRFHDRVPDRDRHGRHLAWAALLTESLQRILTKQGINFDEF